MKQTGCGKTMVIDVGRKLKQISTPRREVGNIVVQIYIKDYRRGIAELQHNVVGRLMIQRGDSSLTNMMLKKKLESIRSIQNFKLRPLK